MKIAYLGMGNMGWRMAANLHKAGHDVSVWARPNGGSWKNAEMLAAKGLHACTTIREAYGELPVRILFAEVPGVLIEIRDMDFDYVDAELILQDIAYFPLGHPIPGTDGIAVNYDSKSGVAGILQSLLTSQASEGED